jgi:hypothetical protein
MENVSEIPSQHKKSWVWWHTPATLTYAGDVSRRIEFRLA